MTDVVAGIKEEELRSLSLEILRYHDDIGILLGEIDGYMEQLPNCYQGPPCKKILSKYQKVSSQYTNVKSNLKNYAKDLQAVITALKSGEKNLTFLFDTFTSDTIRETRSNKEIIPKRQAKERIKYTWH